MTSIVKVMTNLKVGADVEIGPKTLIVGPNGSGKSTIINGIELALTGRAGDIAGRADVGREADIMSLAQAGLVQTVSSVVTFGDGHTAGYFTEGSTAKAKKAVWEAPKNLFHDEMLPIRNLRDAVLGSATTARKYLLTKVAGSVSRDDVRALMPEQVQELWTKLSQLSPPSALTTDVLVSVLEEAGKRQRSANDEAKAARNAAKLVSGDFASPPSEAEIARAKKAHVEARQAFVQADRSASVAGRLVTAQARVESLTAKFDEAQNRLGRAIVLLETTPVLSGGSVLAAALATAKASVQNGVCLVCDGVPANIPNNITQMEAALKEVARSAEARTRAETEMRLAESQRDSTVTALKLAEEEVARLSEEATAESISPAEAEAALDEAGRRLAELEAARDNWAVVQRSESVAVDADRRVSEWKVLKESCEAAVGMVLDRAIKDFITKVQANLPSTDTFAMVLRDGDREVVKFGLVRDGQLHTALSGAEWARVMAAMADACVPEGKYACIIPEERAFDPATLTSVMKALGQSRHQVVLASPVKPSRVPAGWTVVERG